MSEEQQIQKSPSAVPPTNSLLGQLNRWYIAQCNGDWEHGRGIIIKTIDNPGWMLDVDLQGLKGNWGDIPYTLHEASESDWYAISLENNYFRAYGDMNKLEFLIERFLEVVG